MMDCRGRGAWELGTTGETPHWRGETCSPQHSHRKLSQMEICLAGRCLLLTITDRYIQYAAGWEVWGVNNKQQQ